MRPDAETGRVSEDEKNDEGEREGGRLDADEERRRAELVRQGMAPHIALSQVLRARKSRPIDGGRGGGTR